jgi:hypothetical protein
MGKQPESAVKTPTQHCLLHSFAPFKAFDKQGPNKMTISSIGMQVRPRFESSDLDSLIHMMEFRIDNVKVPPGKKYELHYLGRDSKVCQGMRQ